MVMLRKSKEGFLLIDSLITVFVTSLVCITCYAIFQSIVNYDKGYEEYKEKTNDDLLSIFQTMYECEDCQLDESD